ncbi:hypothetical protein [Microbacterium yannicii]|uniref:hypothetical protein n=1 Tax=Microbacterium yannicii TaxID=671622 RepID=UPI0012F8B643|nr:hypothetical protein [Microbacterium yannicii]
MTEKHRNRLLFVAGLAVLGLGIAVGPVFVNEGFWVGLGLFTLSAIAPAVVLGIVAYIWHGNDKETLGSSVAPQSLPRQ